MNALKARGEALENLYAHGESVAFLARARRNRLVGRWAGAQLGLNPESAEAYAAALVAAEAEGTDVVFDRVRADFHASGLPHSVRWLERQMAQMLESARAELREG